MLKMFNNLSTLNLWLGSRIPMIPDFMDTLYKCFFPTSVGASVSLSIRKRLVFDKNLMTQVFMKRLYRGIFVSSVKAWELLIKLLESALCAINSLETLFSDTLRCAHQIEVFSMTFSVQKHSPVWNINNMLQLHALTEVFYLVQKSL